MSFPFGRWLPMLCLCWLTWSSLAHAGVDDAYRRAIQLAQQGRDGEAVAMLDGVAQALPPADAWRARIEAAAALLDMRRRRARRPVALHLLPPGSVQARLAARYFRDRPAPKPARAWAVAVLAAVLPGAGHAWLGRWHDAATAALLVWPMLLLTAWAWRRRMGPVTAFFALVTAWLWSGSVFSAIALAERGGMEAYLDWWRELWRFAAIPGRPW